MGECQASALHMSGSGIQTKLQKMVAIILISTAGYPFLLHLRGRPYNAGGSGFSRIFGGSPCSTVGAWRVGAEMSTVHLVAD